jgi:hypothetical protein
VELLAHEDRRAILLGSCFQPLTHVYVRRQVTCVDLVVATNSAFN